jgi:hypothetical protein
MNITSCHSVILNKFPSTKVWSNWLAQKEQRNRLSNWNESRAASGCSTFQTIAQSMWSGPNCQWTESADYAITPYRCHWNPTVLIEAHVKGLPTRQHFYVDGRWAVMRAAAAQGWNGSCKTHREVKRSGFYKLIQKGLYYWAHNNNLGDIETGVRATTVIVDNSSEWELWHNTGHPRRVRTWRGILRGNGEKEKRQINKSHLKKTEFIC